MADFKNSLSVRGVRVLTETDEHFTQYIYNSSGAQSLNRFNNWGNLMTAISTIEGDKVIQFEQDETIPSGAHNLDNVTLRGNGQEYSAGGLTLTFGTGVTISSWLLGKIESLRLLSTSSAPVMTITGNNLFTISVVSHVHSTTVPFFLGSVGGQHTFVLRDSGRWMKLGGGVENYDNTTAANTTYLIISRGEGSFVDPDTFKSTNDVIYIDVVQDPANDLDTYSWPQTHTNLVVGASVPIMYPRAGSIQFTPSGSLSSTTVQDAIEELDGGIAGTYDSPSVTGVANVASASHSGAARWHRINDIIFVHGRVNIDPTTAGTVTQWRVAVPVASNFTNSQQGSGMAVSNLAGEPAAFAESVSATDDILFTVTPTSASAHVYAYSYSYGVI